VRDERVVDYAVDEAHCTTAYHGTLVTSLMIFYYMCHTHQKIRRFDDRYLGRRANSVAEMDHLHNILALKRRYLRDLEQKTARFGAAYLPTYMALELEDVRKEIASIEASLQQATTTLPRVSKSVFISYSSQDIRWLERLQEMLKPLLRSNTMLTWDATHLRPGVKWREQTALAISLANVAVLLVSPHYLASDNLIERELTPLLDAAEHNGLTILWVAVSASMYQVTPIANYRPVNDPGRPLDTLSRAAANKVLVGICEQIVEAAQP
jgi:hypothetical protein